jgi:hypothetical protein
MRGGRLAKDMLRARMEYREEVSGPVDLDQTLYDDRRAHNQSPIGGRRIPACLEQ